MKTRIFAIAAASALALFGASSLTHAGDWYGGNWGGGHHHGGHHGGGYGGHYGGGYGGNWGGYHGHNGYGHGGYYGGYRPGCGGDRYRIQPYPYRVGNGFSVQTPGFSFGYWK